MSANQPNWGPPSPPPYQQQWQPPSPPPPPSKSVEPSPSAGRPEKLDAVVSALTSAGFACSDSLTSPVLVVRCVAEPALSDGDQVVTLQAQDEAVTYAHLKVDTFDQAHETTKLYQAAMTAVTSTLLPPADAAILRTSKEREPRIGWGKARQSHDNEGTRHDLTLTAKGTSPKILLDGQTKATVAKVTQTARSKGFTCKVKPDIHVTGCSQTRGTEVYSIDSYSICGTAQEQPGYCETVGGNASWVHAYVGFGKNVTDQVFARILAHLQLVADLALGESSAEVHQWIADHLDGKAHHTDLAGVHLAILPGSGGRGHAGNNPNIVALEVDGIRAY
jgi:hypothetical protein